MTCGFEELPILSFRVPFIRRIIDQDLTGPIRITLRASLAGEIEARAGIRILVPDFRVDTGAMYTLISAEWARRHFIPMPDMTSRLLMRTASGLQSVTVRDGELRVRFPQLPNQVFRLYCLFSEDYSPTNPPLLGLNNFFDLFRTTFTGHYSPEAPFGHMLLESS
jgi:hypothetical protein